MTSAPTSLDQFLPSVLRETWEVFQKNALTFVIAALIATFLSAITLGLLAGPLFVGFIDLVRRARRGEAVQMGEVFGRFDSFGSSLIATVLIGIAIIIGCSLLVVPGLLVALFTGFTFHAIAYERASAIDAIKRSVQIVREQFLVTLVLFLVIGVLQTVGGSIVLGALLTLPLGMIAATVAYEQLSNARAPELAQVSAP